MRNWWFATNVGGADPWNTRSCTSLAEANGDETGAAGKTAIVVGRGWRGEEVELNVTSWSRFVFGVVMLHVSAQHGIVACMLAGELAG